MEDDKKMQEEELTTERLLSGDRPSVYAIGMIAAHSIRSTGMAVFMVDALGRVHIMPPEAVQVLIEPKVSESALDQLPEEDAIRLMESQNDTEDEIVRYLKERARRENAR